MQKRTKIWQSDTRTMTGSEEVGTKPGAEDDASDCPLLKARLLSPTNADNDDSTSIEEAEKLVADETNHEFLAKEDLRAVFNDHYILHDDLAGKVYVTKSDRDVLLGRGGKSACATACD